MDIPRPDDIDGRPHLNDEFKLLGESTNTSARKVVCAAQKGKIQTRCGSREPELAAPFSIPEGPRGRGPVVELSAWSRRKNRDFRREGGI